MIHKKLFFGLLVFFALVACAAPTAMLGPLYTFTATGNVVQTGISYGSGELVKKKTGKTTFENIQDISSKPKEKNIKKETLESEDFYILVKNRIEKNGLFLNQSNQ